MVLSGHKGLLRPITVKSVFVALCLWFGAGVVLAQSGTPASPVRSYSGQFISFEVGGKPNFGPSPLAARVPIAGSFAFLITGPPRPALAETNRIPLVPALLIDSCERIKELFLLELGFKDDWRGRIKLIINAAWPEDHEPALTAIFDPAGWRYELELPRTIEPQNLMRAVVQTLLTELVNRGAGSHSAEIPFWLIEGMSGHLQTYSLPTFILQPNAQTIGAENVRIGGLAIVRASLREHAALTFQQLSWPEASDASGTEGAVYRSCAQLLFENLLHFNDGRLCMRRMFQEMPRHLNWQTAFLLGFHSHFATLLDVEKWWGLTTVSFTSSDLTAPRTEQECWHKLQDALDVPVEIHLDKSRMPTEARLTLQEVIMQWEPSAALAAVQRTMRELGDLQLFAFRCDVDADASGASPALQRSAHDLTALQIRIKQEFSPLVSRYEAVLISYLKRSQAGASATSDGRPHPPSLMLLKKDTVRELNNLDGERVAIRAKFLPETKPQYSSLESNGPRPVPIQNTQFHP